MEVECQHCNGSGRVPLKGVYLETYSKLQRMTRAGTPCVAARAAEYFGCKPTALNNRLAWLQEHSLASSEKHGRERRYTAT